MKGVLIKIKLKGILNSILKKNERLFGVVSNILSTIIKGFGKVLPIIDNQILITANSMGYNDSPRVIFEELMKSEISETFEIVWALKNPNDLPVEYRNLVKVVAPDTISYFKMALQSKYWLASVNIERGLQFKKKDTVFLNTWHGVPIKKVGNAVKNRSDFNWDNTNYICYSNDTERNIYIKDFNAKPSSMIPCGLPRNDELYNVGSETKDILKKDLGLEKNKKIILYAPTWRDSEELGQHYKLDIPIDWALWQEKLEKDYIILLRAHPYTTKLMGLKFNKFIRNFSDYPKINDLLIVSDILISDYSSIIFDYTILTKPIILFTYDYDEYRRSRGLYIDLEKEMSTRIFKHEKDLLYHIDNLDFKKEAEFSRYIKDKYVVYGGMATNTCLNLLLNKSQKSQKNNNR